MAYFFLYIFYLYYRYFSWFVEEGIEFALNFIEHYLRSWASRSSSIYFKRRYLIVYLFLERQNYSTFVSSRDSYFIPEYLGWKFLGFLGNLTTFLFTISF